MRPDPALYLGPLPVVTISFEISWVGSATIFVAETFMPFFRLFDIAGGDTPVGVLLAPQSAENAGLAAASVETHVDPEAFPVFERQGSAQWCRARSALRRVGQRVRSTGQLNTRENE